MSKGASFTSQDSMSSTAWLTVGPSVSAERATRTPTKMSAAARTGRKTRSVAAAASAGGQPRDRSQFAGRLRTRASINAITTAPHITQSCPSSQSAATPMAAMTSRRHEYAASRSTTGWTGRRPAGPTEGDMAGPVTG